MRRMPFSSSFVQDMFVSPVHSVFLFSCSQNCFQFCTRMNRTHMWTHMWLKLKVVSSA